ncbi:MAG: FeoB-associated Cys-rich membrane protein [Verrucomicrobiota bacterium]
MSDWQTPAAMVVVLITAAWLMMRFFKKRRNQGNCGKSCGCGAEKKVRIGEKIK